jgi:hypothetical protein
MGKGLWQRQSRGKSYPYIIPGIGFVGFVIGFDIGWDYKNFARTYLILVAVYSENTESRNDKMNKPVCSYCRSERMGASALLIPELYGIKPRIAFVTYYGGMKHKNLQKTTK